MIGTKHGLGFASLLVVATTCVGCYFNRDIYNLDNDGDGFDEVADCDDSNPEIFPGAAEICGDGVDNDCDGKLDFADPECGTIGSGGSGGDGSGGDGAGGSGASGGSGGDGSGGDSAGGSGGSGGGSGGSGGAMGGGGAGGGGSVGSGGAGGN